MTAINYNEIYENFYYSEDSPSGLRWAVNSGNKYIGDIAGSKSYHKNGTPKCWDVRVHRRLVKVHRIVCLLNGYTLTDKHVVNHKDCNPHNNLIENLEVVNQTTNMRKCKTHINLGLQSNNTTGINGVSSVVKDGCITAYSANIRGADGTKVAFVFSVKRYGTKLALALAKTARDVAIEELEKEGVYYG